MIETNLQIKQAEPNGPAWNPRQRNLGIAIILVAIEDYRRCPQQPFEGAAIFLYGNTPHYHKIVELAGVDPVWLREHLDRCRQTWDAERRKKLDRLASWNAARLRAKADRKPCEGQDGASGPHSSFETRQAVREARRAAAKKRWGLDAGSTDRQAVAQ